MASISGWAIGGIVAIGFLLLTFVCYQVYHNWEGVDLPDWLSFSDTWGKKTCDNDDSGSQRIGAVRTLAQKTAAVVPSNTAEGDPAPVQPADAADDLHGPNRQASSRIVKPCKKPRKDRDGPSLRDFMEEMRAHRQQMDKRDKQLVKLLQHTCNYEPTGKGHTGSKLAKMSETVLHRVTSSIDARLGQYLDTRTKKMVPGSFRKIEQPYWIHVSAADYDVGTNILSVPVNKRNCNVFELVQASVPRLQYTINDYCNKFTVYAAVDASDTGEKHDYTEYIVTLDNADYTAASLAVALAVKINAAVNTGGATAFNDAGNNRSMAVAFNAVAYKYTFTLTTSSGALQRFYFKFDHPDVAYILGFGTKNIFPAFTQVTDDVSGAQYVVDTTVVSEAVAVPATTATYPWYTVSAVRSQYTGATINASASTSGTTTAIVSTGRVDLFGGRYVVLQCSELKSRYVDDDTVAIVSQADEMNVVDYSTGNAYFRTFASPAVLRTLALSLKMRMPSGKIVDADTSLLSFDLRFVAMFENATLDRTKHMPGGSKYTA